MSARHQTARGRSNSEYLYLIRFGQFRSAIQNHLNFETHFFFTSQYEYLPSVKAIEIFLKLE